MNTVLVTLSLEHVTLGANQWHPCLWCLEEDDAKGHLTPLPGDGPTWGAEGEPRLLSEGSLASALTLATAPGSPGFCTGRHRRHKEEPCAGVRGGGLSEAPTLGEPLLGEDAEKMRVDRTRVEGTRVEGTREEGTREEGTRVEGMQMEEKGLWKEVSALYK